MEGAAKRYRLYGSPAHRLSDLLLRRRSHAERWALRDIGFSIAPGETVAIVGANGAGKSTLLGLVAGTTVASQGRVEVSGRVSALLELGAGFHPEWTGRQNAEFHLRLRGVKKAAAKKRIEEIEDFAAIGTYFDQPLRTYSSGMAVRVAFAAAIACDPEILIVDEALAVGDAPFQHKCFQRIGELKEKGVTILLVTHRLDIVAQLCSRALVLHEGRLVFDGSAGDAVTHYVDIILAGGGASGREPAQQDYRMGIGGARIETVGVEGRPPGAFSFASGETARFAATIRFDADVATPIFGFSIKTVEDVLLYCVTGDMVGAAMAPAKRGEVREIRAECPLPLPAGTFFADFSIADYEAGEARILDAWISALRLDVHRARPFLGLVDLGARIAAEERAE
jgi:ABC-type polysaccharide/polyol phosphate transport system ATPase subunit